MSEIATAAVAAITTDVLIMASSFRCRVASSVRATMVACRGKWCDRIGLGAMTSTPKIFAETLLFLTPMVGVPKLFAESYVLAWHQFKRTGAPYGRPVRSAALYSSVGRRPPP